MDALYLPDGDAVVATALTQGGWNPQHQHGGPVQALLARAVEKVPTLTAMRVSRLTFDMVRPAPIGPRLTIDTDIVRQGKKIQVVDTVLRDGDTELVRCRALRLRIEDTSQLASAPTATGPDRELPAPEGFETLYREFLGQPGVPGLLEAVALRRFPVPGTEGVDGYWIRLERALVAGEEPTPLQRLALAGDFSNTIGMAVDGTEFTTINPDITVQVLRDPQGEWVAVTGATRFDLAAGIGVSDAELHDERGFCAASTTCQLLQPR